MLALTFAEAADAVIALHTPTWRNPQSGPQWRASLETYSYPSLGEMPVSEITFGLITAMLLPIWNDKPETARRVKQRISAICCWSVVQGYRTDDSVGIVGNAALPRNATQRRSMPAFHYDDVADSLAKVKASHRTSAS